jgi:CRP/FNR family transcriptional regulator
MPSPRIDLTADADVRGAVGASHLRDLSAELIADLAVSARRIRIAAGATIHREGEAEPHLELVIAGLIRVHVSAPDGRTMTVRYCRPGALIGTPTLYAAVSRPFAIQALTESELLRFQPAIVRALADRDLRVAKALLTETSERVLSFVGELSGNAFATVRERVARHLLDLASEHQRGAELVAYISQQELADAVGTVREVVVRVLRELRREGVVQTGRDRIIVRDPERLLLGLEIGGAPLMRTVWNEGS